MTPRQPRPTAPESSAAASNQAELREYIANCTTVQHCCIAAMCLLILAYVFTPLPSPMLNMASTIAIALFLKATFVKFTHTRTLDAARRGNPPQ